MYIHEKADRFDEICKLREIAVERVQQSNRDKDVVAIEQSIIFMNAVVSIIEREYEDAAVE